MSLDIELGQNEKTAILSCSQYILQKVTDKGGESPLEKISIERERAHVFGPFPAELLILANLRVLNLFNNALSGPIPEQISSLSNLSELNLSANNMSGPIPSSLGAMVQLEVLDLYRNAFDGEIPVCTLIVSFRHV